MKSGYYIGETPVAAAAPVVLPAGYSLVPTPPPAPITAATGGLNLDWRGEPIPNPRQLVPVVEMHQEGHAIGKPAFVPLHELDSFVGELSDDFDFGLAEYEIQNPEELAALTFPKFALPKLSFSIGQGKYAPLKLPNFPTKKAPVRAAVKSVQAKGKKPMVLARKKPSQSNSARTASVADMYAALKKQGQLVNLLATKKRVTSEHNKRMGQDGFRDTVMSLLRKIEKQCAGDISGNYFSRWNRLKSITGVAVHEK